MNRPFSQALQRGHVAERQWVNEMQDAGHAVAHGKKLNVPDFNPSKDRCHSPDAVALVRVEIKQRDLTFTSPEDFPYPTAFVRNLSGESTDLTLPLVYILRSAPTKCWVWVLGADRDETWTESLVRDTTRGSMLRMLSCPKEDLRPSETLLPFLIKHDLLSFVEGDTTAFLRAKEDPRTKGVGEKAHGRERTTKGKAR